MSSISKAETDEKIGDFWDTHDLTDFDTDAPDVEFSVSFAVLVEVELLGAISSKKPKGTASISRRL